MFKTSSQCFSNFNVHKNALAFLLKCRFKNTPNFMKKVRIMVIFAGVMAKRGMRELTGICNIQYMCEMSWTLRNYMLYYMCYSAVIVFLNKYNKHFKWRFLGHAAEKMPLGITQCIKVGRDLLAGNEHSNKIRVTEKGRQILTLHLAIWSAPSTPICMASKISAGAFCSSSWTYIS